MSSLESKLKTFFETNPLAVEAASSIRPGREISIRVKEDSTFTDFTFLKEKKQNKLNLGAASEPDFVFEIPEKVALELTEKNFSSIAQVGLFLFEKILSADESEKVRVQLKTSILNLVLNGYLGILSSGGTEIAKFLSTKGLGNLGKLKEAIGKLRS